MAAIPKTSMPNREAAPVAVPGEALVPVAEPVPVLEGVVEVVNPEPF
jgi:hypothetical protein